jgi:hypothetical protein
MGNNKEIRQRMDTYRGILLAINWICSIIGIIVGFVLLSQIGVYAVIIIIIAFILGIVGHFIINVALAIPFILLNNGDYLAAIVNEKNQKAINDVPVGKKDEPVVEKINNDISTTKEIKNNINSENKNVEIERLEKLFESTTDEKEKSLIAKQLYELGQTYYWRFIPKEMK